MCVRVYTHRHAPSHCTDTPSVSTCVHERRCTQGRPKWPATIIFTTQQAAATAVAGGRKEHSGRDGQRKEGRKEGSEQARRAMEMESRTARMPFSHIFIYEGCLEYKQFLIIEYICIFWEWACWEY